MLCFAILYHIILYYTILYIYIPGQKSREPAEHLGTWQEVHRKAGKIHGVSAIPVISCPKHSVLKVGGVELEVQSVNTTANRKLFQTNVTAVTNT